MQRHSHRCASKFLVVLLSLTLGVGPALANPPPGKGNKHGNQGHGNQSESQESESPRVS